MNRKISLSIEGIGSFEGIWTPVESPIPPIVEPEPPIEPPVIEPEPPIVDPPTDDFIQFTDEYFKGIESGIMELEKGKTYRVDYIKAMDVENGLIIEGNGANLLIGIENYNSLSKTQDGHLFTLKGGNIVFRNVNFCHPKQKLTSSTFYPSIFKAAQGDNFKWTVLVENCNTTALGRNGGFGIGFLYGGLEENHIGLINFKHAGPGFIDPKNPYVDSVLYVTLQDVETDFENESEWGQSKVKCRGYVKDGIFTITSDNVDTSYFLDNYQFVDSMYNKNETFIAHADRFVFLLEGKNSILNEKQFKLRDSNPIEVDVISENGKVYFPAFYEPHAGMMTSQGMVLTKDRTEGDKWVDWVEGGRKDLVSMLVTTLENPLPNGKHRIKILSDLIELPEQEFWVVAKQNFLFPTSLNTKFGDYQVLNTNQIGHLWYGHSNVSIWAKDTNLRGYFRQSGNGKGKCLGVNLVNCTGFDDQFGPVVPVTNDVSIKMPERISGLLDNQK